MTAPSTRARLSAIGRGHTLSPAALIAIAAALDVVFLHALWLDFENWGIWDWDYQASLLEAARISLLQYGQLPAWNPWMGGGSALIGHPLSSVCSPKFTFIAIFGTVPGIKICIFAYLLLGQIGIYRLVRYTQGTRQAALLAALVFGWGGAYAQHLTHGHLEWVAYSWVPWLLSALLGASRGSRPKPLVSGAVFLAAAWLDGGPYQYAFLPLFLLLFALLLAIQNRSPRPLFACGLIGVGAAGLAAIEIAPMLEIVRLFPRATPETNRFYGIPAMPGTGELLVQGFLSRVQSHDPGVWMPLRINAGTYVGVLPATLAVFGLATRRGRFYGMLALIMLSLFASDTLPVQPWRILHALPGFSSLKEPTRFNFFVLLCLALSSAEGLDALRRWAGDRKGFGVLVAVVIGVVGVDLFCVNGRVFESAFSLPPARVEPAGEFIQRGRSSFAGRDGDPARPVWNDKQEGFASFPSILENTGVLDTLPALKHPRSALPAGHPGYRGEVFVAGEQGWIASYSFSPNRWRVAVRGPALVVINQNFQPGWHVDGVEGAAPPRVRPYQGLLSAELPAGNHEIEFVYSAPFLPLGAALSGITALLMSCALWLDRGTSSRGSEDGGRKHA